jgi:hypothetical protein
MSGNCTPSVRGPGVLAAGFAAVLSLSAAACSTKSSGGFSSDDASGGSGDDGASGGGSSSSSSGGSGGGSSSGLNLNDAGNAGGMGNGTCKDGMYAGTYECSFNFSADGGPVDTEGGFNDAGFVVTGPLSFSLTQNTGSGESFIDTASGNFGGTCCLNLFTISSTLNGSLNCNTGTFTGTLTDGGYTGLGMMGTFSGPLGSQYNGTNAAFVDGTWSLDVPGAGTCVGDWNAAYTGP